MRPVAPARRNTGGVIAALSVACVFGFLAASNQVLLAFVLLASAGLVGVMAIRRHLDWAMIALIVFIPFYSYLLARVFLLGAPANALNAAKFWKELILAVLAFELVTAARPSWSGLDRLVIAFLGLLAVYILLPSPSSFNVRFYAAREDGAFLIIFLAARRLPLPDRLPTRAQRAILATGAAIAAIGVWNHQSPDGFNNFINQTGLPLFNAVVNQTQTYSVYHATFLGTDYVRAGSVFLNPLSLAFFLLIPIGIALAAWALGRARWWHLSVGALCTLALLMTLTRSVIVTLPLMVALALIVTRRNMRIAAVLLVVCLALWPATASFGLHDSLQAGSNPADPDRTSHVQFLIADVPSLLAHPFGLGLGVGGASGLRFSKPVLDEESWYFQVGHDVGIAGMAAFIGIVIWTLAILWRRAREGSQEALGALCALTVISIGMFFHILFTDLSVSWTAWLLAGLGCRVLPEAAPAPAGAASGGSVLASLRPAAVTG